MSQQQIDEAKAEAFAGQLIGVLNNGALALMISIGHRTGLFDALAEASPATIQELAQKAGLQERYVREWLGAMLTGGVVEYDPATQKFNLPAEHAAFLTRAAVPNNIAAFAQYIPLLGRVEDELVECFEKGGGVPYSSYPRFQDVMAEDSGQTVVAALLEHILPIIPGSREALEKGVELLDIGCGSARALNLLARTFPNSRFTGYDISDKGIERGRAEAAEHGITNLTLEVRDCSDLGATDRFQIITAFDAIHDQKHPDRVLASVAQALHPEGTFLMQDVKSSREMHKNIDHPVGTLLYTVSCMHCTTVSLAAGGPGLGAMWGEELAEEMLRAAGFQSVNTQQLDHDFQNNYYVCRLS